MKKKTQSKKEKRVWKETLQSEDNAGIEDGSPAPQARETLKNAKVQDATGRTTELRNLDGSAPDSLDLLIKKQKVSILYVDDDMVQVKLVIRMLERLGYQAVGTTDCQEALAFFRDTPDRFDLIISDLSMPTMTGRDLGQQVRKVRKDIPIILCTGYGMLNDRYFDDELYINAYVSKPFTLRKIDDTIRTVLKKTYQLFYEV
jgi:CheY-like chemotaxis protein